MGASPDMFDMMIDHETKPGLAGLGQRFGKELFRSDTKVDRGAHRKNTDSGQREHGYETKVKESRDWRRIERYVKNIANSVNVGVEREFGVANLVDDECKLRPDAFLRTSGGFYTKEQIGEYNAEVALREIGFAKKALGLTREPGELDMKSYYDNKRRSRSYRAEILTLSLLHRVFGESFIVVKSTDYDDYVNSVDYILVDRVSGATVCAFDGVASFDGQYMSDKQKRIEYVARNGGKKLNYSIHIDKNRSLVRGPSSMLPMFFVDLNNDEQSQIMRSIANSPELVSGDEVEICQRITSSLEKQLAVVRRESDRAVRNTGIPRTKFNSYLEQFDRSLQRMRSILSNIV